MDALEKIIRPIVEGQIRGFLKEHPVIVEAVDWYKPRRDKTVTFVNSLAKRIIKDLTCPMVRARLAAALLEGATEARHSSTVEFPHCGEAGQHGIIAVLAAPQWKPIDTAPKDGSWVLIAARNLHPCDAQWAHDGINDNEGWRDIGGFFNTQPTHWMPLPVLPSLTSR